MILGIDIRAAAFGWSLLDEAASSFVGLGIHALGQPSRPDKSTISQVDREHGLARVLAKRAPGCSTVVVERWIPEAVPELGVGLAWGSVLGVVAMMTPAPRLITIEPGSWQQELLLGAPGWNAARAYANAVHVLCGHPRAEAALIRMRARDRDPAVAASMVALMGALRLGKSTRSRTSSPRVERP